MSAAVDRVIDLLDGARQSGDSWTAKCPAHDDKSPSLSVSERTSGDPGALVHCHAGCTAEQVVHALGLAPADLFDAKPTDSTRRIAATYDYCDEQGKLLMQVVRYDPKDFRQRRPDGQGGGAWRLGDTRLVPYRLPELRKAEPDKTVFVVEGEKDVDALIAAGHVATCGPMGAGKWSKVVDEAIAALSGRNVVVVADKDPAGRAHARDVAQSLSTVARAVHVCEALVGKDVADHLGAGHPVDDLEVVASTEDDDPSISEYLVEGDDADAETPVASSVELIDFSAIHDNGDEIVTGLLLPGRWTALAAKAKAGKTTLEMFVSVEISEGRDPFDGIQREPVTVLYVDAEMGRFDLEERLTELGHVPTSLTRWHATDLPPRLDTQPGGAALVVAAHQLGARVVVIDGINGTVEGAEKDDLTWRAFFDHTIAPLKRAGVAVLTGDNLGKDESLGPRGSSVKVDKPDAVVQLKRTDAGVKLTTTHRRTSAYPLEWSLTIDGLDGAGTIRYRHVDSAWPAGTADAARLLDELGVDPSFGRGKTRDALKAAGHGIRNDALAAAIRFRKLRADDLGVAS